MQEPRLNMQASLLVIFIKQLTNSGDIDRLTRFTEYFVATRHQPQIITGVLRGRQVRCLISYQFQLNLHVNWLRKQETMPNANA